MGGQSAPKESQGGLKGVRTGACRCALLQQASSQKHPLACIAADAGAAAQMHPSTRILSNASCQILPHRYIRPDHFCTCLGLDPSQMQRRFASPHAFFEIPGPKWVLLDAFSQKHLPRCFPPDTSPRIHHGFIFQNSIN